MRGRSGFWRSEADVEIGNSLHDLSRKSPLLFIPFPRLLDASLIESLNFLSLPRSSLQSRFVAEVILLQIRGVVQGRHDFRRGYANDG